MTVCDPPLISSVPILELPESRSTNAEVMRRAEQGERGPLWLWTRRQTGGRGRSGRDWISREGDLAATYLFAPAAAPERLSGLSLVAGVAAWTAIAEYAGLAPDRTPSLRLKWPNDVLWEERKLGGILIESTRSGGDGVVAIGIGINVVPVDDIAGRKVASLAEIVGGARAPEAREMLGALAASLERALNQWRCGAGFPDIRRQWLNHAVPIGTSLVVRARGEPVEGRFAGLDDDGALLLSVCGSPEAPRRFTFGDAEILSSDRAKGEARDGRAD